MIVFVRVFTPAEDPDHDPDEPYIELVTRSRAAAFRGPLGDVVAWERMDMSEAADTIRRWTHAPQGQEQDRWAVEAWLLGGAA